MSKRLTTTEFIIKAKKIHGNKYDYSLVDYKNNRTKVKIICSKHGVFEQIPSGHLRGKGCRFCANDSLSLSRRKHINEFIKDAEAVHCNKYDYGLVDYKNNSTKIKIICFKHGVFEQIPSNHLQKRQGCPDCYGNKKRNTGDFIMRANEVHRNRYDYNLVEYINIDTKVVIICKEHGQFKQAPYKHLNGQGCPLCGKLIKSSKGGITKLNVPLYETYAKQLDKYIKVFKIVDKNDLVLLGCLCVYCGKLFIPTTSAVRRKINAIIGKGKGSANLYCSENCKKACPTFGQHKYPKGFKKATSREVQPELRKLVLARDSYKCQICEITIDNAELHCHHIDPVSQNPIESADVDNCITLCKKHHLQVHKLPECGYNELKC